MSYLIRTLLLALIVPATGCQSYGIFAKREAELHCPTDIRKTIPWCAGEDAIFHCPCGPDQDFYGHKPTRWDIWPASGAEWRDVYCGPPHCGTTPEFLDPSSPLLPMGELEVIHGIEQRSHGNRTREEIEPLPEEADALPQPMPQAPEETEAEEFLQETPHDSSSRSEPLHKETSRPLLRSARPSKHQRGKTNREARLKSEVRVSPVTAEIPSQQVVKGRKGGVRASTLTLVAPESHTKSEISHKSQKNKSTRQRSGKHLAAKKQAKRDRVRPTQPSSEGIAASFVDALKRKAVTTARTKRIPRSGR